MKKLFTILLFCVSLFASSQAVTNSFSPLERESLLKELLSSFTSIYNSKIYNLKNGWNKLDTPKNGIDVVKTFASVSQVQVVAAYDKVSNKWGVFTSEKMTDTKRLLFLKYLEPNTTFFVLANSSVSINIKSIEPSGFCKNIMNNNNYAHLTSSAFNKEAVHNINRSISIKSRYATEHEIGIYNESREMLIYPKIDTKGKATYKYGPANPKAFLKYAKEYEEKVFYIYKYKTQKCYKGVFPSMRVPPYPILEEVK